MMFLEMGSQPYPTVKFNNWSTEFIEIPLCMELLAKSRSMWEIPGL